MTVPGWYPDPSGNGSRRYWDGFQWTPHTQQPAPVPARGKTGSRLVLATIALVGAIFFAGLIVNASKDDDRTTAPKPSQSLDDQYIALLSKWAARDGYTLGDRETLIEAGHEACELMSSGSGLISASAEVMDKYGLRPGKDGPAVGVAAEQVLCPENRPR